MKTVMAFGSFDVLHPGHIDYLTRARWLGDYLIVVVARDASMKKLKGVNPIFNEEDRRDLVASLKMVDKAVVGNKLTDPKDRYEIIRQYKPDVIVFGYDQQISVEDIRKWLLRNMLRTRIVRMSQGRDVNVNKSSKIKKRMGL